MEIRYVKIELKSEIVKNKTRNLSKLARLAKLATVQWLLKKNVHLTASFTVKSMCNEIRNLRPRKIRRYQIYQKSYEKCTLMHSPFRFLKICISS